VSVRSLGRVLALKQLVIFSGEAAEADIEAVAIGTAAASNAQASR
jgi:hypothetical protein